MVPPPNTQVVPVGDGLRLHARTWDGDATPFLLLHGLSSNARTWDGVGEALAARGHKVVAVDQRGHGLSEKPEHGYDFATMVADAAALLEAMELDRPVVAGQSWGGNVALELAARRPDLVRAAAGVDGGTIELRQSFDRWEDCAAALSPPRLAGMRLVDLRRRISAAHPDWPADGLEATLHNFEQLPDGTVRPWLTFERHMRILQHLWAHQPSRLYADLAVPVLLVGAFGSEPRWDEVKRARITEATAAIPRGRAVFLQPADHDLHVQQPTAVAGLLAQLAADATR